MPALASTTLASMSTKSSLPFSSTSRHASGNAAQAFGGPGGRASKEIELIHAPVLVDVPAQFLEHAQVAALRNGLFVGKPALAQTRDDVGECGFEGHRNLTGRIHRRRLCPGCPATASANHGRIGLGNGGGRQSVAVDWVDILTGAAPGPIEKKRRGRVARRGKGARQVDSWGS